jgi:hypothetical protein
VEEEFVKVYGEHAWDFNNHEISVMKAPLFDDYGRCKDYLHHNKGKVHH